MASCSSEWKRRRHRNATHSRAWRPRRALNHMKFSSEKTIKKRNTTHRILGSSVALAAAALALSGISAHAATVWNVNIGDEITTSDNFIGAATENTVNSFWNSVTTGAPTNQALSDSTGATTTATLTLAVPPPLNINPAGYAPVTGLELFSTWIKTSDNATPFTMTIGGLSSSPGVTYDLIVYSDWYWKGNEHFPVTQTVGSGLTGTVTLDQISTGTDGTVPGLVEDTDPGANTNIEGNWLRITGLTPDGSGNLAFSMGGTNAAFSGFQLVEAIPEPSTSVLLGGLGVLALLRRCR